VKPKLEPAALKKSRPWELAVRFAFGGVLTVLAGLVTRAFGPVVGGLLLAFPAILPASLTLVKQHDGKAQAIDDARGGRLGSIGLVAFAATVWLAPAVWPPAVVLVVATIVWALINGTVWALQYGRSNH
jgi:hypothetical protein